MKNKVFILLLVVLFITIGCTNQNDGKERLYLSDKYYNKGEFIKVNSEELDKLDGTFIIFAHNNFCSMGVSCEEVFKSFMEKYKIDFIKIQFDLFKDSKYYKYVKYAPTIIVVSDGNVISYLDADKDEDIDKYKIEKEFESWLDNYIYFKGK